MSRIDTSPGLWACSCAYRTVLFGAHSQSSTFYPLFANSEPEAELVPCPQTFAVAAGNLPGNLASLWLIDRLGRRGTCVVCMAGGCACALAFAAAPASGVWPTLAAACFNGVSVPGWNALDAIRWGRGAAAS
eukprot:361118-Chlamydomonas_euryale.AAC.2